MGHSERVRHCAARVSKTPRVTLSGRRVPADGRIILFQPLQIGRPLHQRTRQRRCSETSTSEVLEHHMMTTRHRYAYAAFTGAALTSLLGCAADHESAPSPSSSSMGSILETLAAKVNQCGVQRETCRDAASDGGALGCQEAFKTCRDDVLSAAAPDLEKGVHGCAAEAKTCREAVQTSTEKQSCADTLKACVLGSHPGQDHDAAANQDDHSPAAECAGSVPPCIEAGQSARECAMQLKECLSSRLSGHSQDNRDGGETDHADQGKPDGGKADHGKSDGGARDDKDEDQDEDSDAAVDESGTDGGRSGKRDGGARGNNGQGGAKKP